MSEIPGVEWIRLHYAYPTHFPMDLLRVIREKDNVCKYLDIALQHISDNVLSAMRRNINKEQTCTLLKKIREEVPGIHLRTTLMVGHPGETEEDYKELLDFVKEYRFERLGAFSYCEEEGTYSAIHYQDDVSEETKASRLSKLMTIQQRISAEVASKKMGQHFKVIIDREEGDYYIGRTEYDSPEVDPEVLIKKNNTELKIGSFYDVTIIETDDFDLYATLD
jgi:ribosomal protein S12 methylthiotransferase